MKYSDGLTKKEATSLMTKLLMEDRKLRALGGTGNYAHVEIKESYRRGWTLDDRSDIVRYAVHVTPLVS